MNQLDIKQIVSNCFSQFYKNNSHLIAGADHAIAEVRRYALSLWDARNADEIKRDEAHGVTGIMYIQWCKEEWRQITASTAYEHDVIERQVQQVMNTVRIWAAIDFKENPDVYNVPNSGFMIERFAHHQWLSRNAEQVDRDKRLGIIRGDYVLWCTAEFERLTVEAS